MLPQPLEQLGGCALRTTTLAPVSSTIGGCDLVD
jgi:hypothetical protein